MKTKLSNRGVHPPLSVLFPLSSSVISNLPPTQPIERMSMDSEKNTDRKKERKEERKKEIEKERTKGRENEKTQERTGVKQINEEQAIRQRRSFSFVLIGHFQSTTNSANCQ